MTYTTHPFPHATPLAAIWLGFLACSLHGSALQGFWRIDDLWLLHYVSLHPQASGYFFSPMQWQALSVPFFTPWLVLDFRLDIVLFGPDPMPHYGRHLLVLLLAAWLTFVLLRPHAGWLWSTLGASLFLAGAPTVVLAQQLMARHYADGLVFALLAILLWLHPNKVPKAGAGRWLASVCYLLSMLCKEVFAPLPMVLFFLMTGSFTTRMRAMLPLVVSALAFVLWRQSMIGTLVGGYSNSLELSRFSTWVGTFPDIIFGQGWFVLVAIAGFLTALFVTLTASRQAAMVTVSALFALLLPLLAVAPVSEPLHYRLALLPFWGGCVLFAAGAARLLKCTRLAPVRLMLFALLTAVPLAVALHGRAVAAEYAVITSNLDAHGRFLFSHDTAVGYVPSGAAAGYIAPAHALRQHYGEAGAPRPLPIPEYAEQYAPELPVFSYQSDCRCMMPMHSMPTSRTFRAGLPAAVSIDRRDGGLRLTAEVPPTAACHLVFRDARLTLPVPCQAHVAFDPPNWVQGAVRMVVVYQTEWGASDWFDFPEKGTLQRWPRHTADPHL
ncbi:MAG: hypothetical protein WCY08_00840 [Rhodocyclaceae bacterium]